MYSPILFSISLLTPDEDYVSKALVSLIVLYVSSYRWVHLSRAVLFCQPHQQLFTHSLHNSLACWFFAKAVSINHNVWRERRAEDESNRGPSAYQRDALPLGQSASHKVQAEDHAVYHFSAHQRELWSRCRNSVRNTSQVTGWMGSISLAFFS